VTRGCHLLDSTPTVCYIEVSGSKSAVRRSGLEPEGRRFESSLPDQKLIVKKGAKTLSGTDTDMLSDL
jgi:hypothetical protein